jgi:hypothetical protein
MTTLCTNSRYLPALKHLIAVNMQAHHLICTHMSAYSCQMNTQADVASLARAITDAIGAVGKSKYLVAAETGIPYPTFIRKLKGIAGRAEFTVSELFRIAEVVGADPIEFVRAAGPDANGLAPALRPPRKDVVA